MRFVSWNVNGLRACLTKGFMESFRDMDADVFCLQETKMQEGQAILDLPGYKQFWNSAEKKGYSGTAIFTRVEPIDVTYGIGIEEHDHEGRVITMEFEAVIICGDLNVAHKEIDLKNPKTNHKNAGFTDDERQKFTELLQAGFTDTFRKVYPDVTGAYTWWSYLRKARANNAGWRIDYFLISNRLDDKIESATIYNEIFGSDHCPVGLELK